MNQLEAPRPKTVDKNFYMYNEAVYLMCSTEDCASCKGEPIQPAAYNEIDAVQRAEEYGFTIVRSEDGSPVINEDGSVTVRCPQCTIDKWRADHR